MKTTRILLIIGLLIGAWASPVHAAEATRVQAILIIASDKPARTDSRLARYEPTLKRILRFESYQFQGQGSAIIQTGKSSHISLGEGQSLVLTAESGERTIRVIWEKDNRTVMKTGLTLRPGVPAVLGGPGTRRAGEVYAIILTAN